MTCHLHAPSIDSDQPGHLLNLRFFAVVWMHRLNWVFAGAHVSLLIGFVTLMLWLLLQFLTVLSPLAVQKACIRCFTIWAPSSEFVSSSIPSWQILTAHAQPFRAARDLAFCLKVPLDSLLVWASSEGSGETARMRRLAWTFAARIGDKYQIRLTRSIY